MDQKQGITTLIDARLHALYCGVTQSGKTTLAREHCRVLHAAGWDVAVYDPVATATAGGGWTDEGAKDHGQTVRIFSDHGKFFAWLVKAKGTPDHPVFVFADESADIFGHRQTDAHWLPRRIRHEHIYLRLISQRPKMLPPDVRSQCAICYMFRLAADDRKMVASDFGHDSEVYNKNLDTGDFLVLISGSSEIEECNVFALVD